MLSRRVSFDRTYFIPLLYYMPIALRFSSKYPVRFARFSRKAIIERRRAEKKGTGKRDEEREDRGEERRSE